MSFDTQGTWKDSIVAANFYGIGAILCFEAWSKREILKPSRSRISALYHSFLQRLREPEPERIAEMRYINLSRLMPLLKCLAMLILLTFFCRQAAGRVLVRYGFRTDYIWPLHIAVAYSYLSLTFLAYSGLTPRMVDTLLLVFFLIMTAVGFLVSWDRFVATGTVRALWRAFLSVACMNTKVTCPINLLHTIAMCGRCLQERSIDPPIAFIYCGSEMLAWCCTTCLSLTTESWFKELLHNEAAATAAKRAVERLLSSYTDTVVRLGPELCISNATPKLMHLMCPTTLADSNLLRDTAFSKYLATETDKDRFAQFMSNSHAESIEGPAPALCVNLHHELGSKIFVELVHVNLSALGHAAEHVIGIREIRTEGIPPDESKFEGSKTSFIHSTEPDAAAVHAISPNDLVFQRSKRMHRQLSRSSRSSRSSSSGSSVSNLQYNKRKIKELDRIELTFNGNTQLQKYSLCFETAKVELENCLFGESKAPFMNWMHNNTNSLLWENCGYLTYPGELCFRPPNGACASSTVLLCAEAVSLRCFEVEGSASDDEDDQSDGVTFELRLSRISQLTLQKSLVEHTRRQLQVLVEENIADLSAS